MTPEERCRLREKIAEMLGVEVGEIPQDIEYANLSDLGLNSLDVVEVVMEVEEELRG